MEHHRDASVPAPLLAQQRKEKRFEKEKRKWEIKTKTKSQSASNEMSTVLDGFDFALRALRFF
jgi:hypothetical protein